MRGWHPFDDGSGGDVAEERVNRLPDGDGEPFQKGVGIERTPFEVDSVVVAPNMSEEAGKLPLASLVRQEHPEDGCAGREFLAGVDEVVASFHTKKN